MLHTKASELNTHPFRNQNREAVKKIIFSLMKLSNRKH